MRWGKFIDFGASYPPDSYLADLNDLNCNVPLPASEHRWSEEQYSVAELVSMAMRIVEASRSITWDIWDQEQRTSAGTLNLTNLSVDSTSREAGAEACWKQTMWIHVDPLGFRC